MKKLGILLFTIISSIQIISAQNNFQRTNAENGSSVETFSVPQAFNSALDSLVYTYYSQHAKKGHCRKSPDVNVEFSDSVYKKRLAALPYEISMPYNKAVKSFIDFYAGRKRKQVENMLGLSKYYFPIFEDALNKYNMPMELKYLPVIESALNTGAVSPVGAAGLWQFMPSTGKMYGLEVNTLVDERRDPLKASYAAARFIKDLYNIYGDWHLAIAAYNCGPGNVNKAIRRSGGKRDFWSIYPYLPAETRSYVPIFIAANYVMTYYSNHNLCPSDFDMPAYTDTVLVEERVSFTEIASTLKIPIEELKILNPQYRRDIIPGNGGTYYLRLPNHYASKFVELKDTIYAHSRAKEQVVKEDSIAHKQEDAPIFDSHKRKKEKEKNSHKKTTYKVRNGDNLSDIADKYNVSVSDIKKWNGLNKSKIMSGQRLIIKK